MEIDRKKIEDWAEEYPAQAEFPLLIAKMVYATLAPGDYSYIPWGSAVNIGGWDGLVYSVNGAGFIPAGRSVIEFGTDASPKKKAEKDYSTRSDSKGKEIDKSQTTFIFMTPRCWMGCEKWQEAKKKENVWKDVRVYDSRGISSLLANMESVTFWLARKIGLCPDSGVIDAERYWKEGIISSEVELNPHFFIAGRTGQLARLEEVLDADVPITAVSASSKEEALEFILAAGMSFSGDNDKRFKSKALVVTDVDALRRLPSTQGLIIIPMFEDARPLHLMAAQGNCVLIPLGADTDYKNETIELTRADKHELVSALEECGITHDRAERLVRDAACSITAIKKDLCFFVQRAEWLNNENVTELFAALLCEQWNENAEGDKVILEKLSGLEFDEYKQILEKWSRLPLSPVLKIGATWRLVSPLSLWTDLTKILPVNWKTMFREVCQKVFLFSNTEPQYSPQLRNGLLHTLIIVALYGHRIRLNDAGQEFADNIINLVLKSDTPKQWDHIHNLLSLIAEAAPEVFLQYVRKSINNPNHPIISLFEEKEGFLFPESHHTDLLWALEGLAWLPEYLKGATEMLFELSDLDPGGRLGNRPYNSLIEIYNPWVPQTSVDLNSRIEILKACVKKRYGRIWDLLLALLPNTGMAISQTHKLKWRKFDIEIVHEEPYAASSKFMHEAISMLKDSYDNTDKKMAELLKHIEMLPHRTRKELIGWIGEKVASIDDNAPISLRALRETLWYQGICGSKDSTNFDEEELNTIKAAYERLLPEDIIQRNLWLFDDYYPHLPTPNGDASDVEKSHKECSRLRKEACDKWLSEIGIEKTIELRLKVGEAVTLGSTLAYFDQSEIDDKIVSLLVNQDDFAFVRSYIIEKEEMIGEDAVIEMFKTFSEGNNKEEDKVRFLCSMKQSLSLWKFIETLPSNIQTAYWKKVVIHFIPSELESALYVIGKLCLVGRAITAINGSWHHAQTIPTKVLQEVLCKVLDSPIELNGTLDYLSAETYLEELHKRKDRDEKLLEKLEWSYLPLMSHHPKKANVEVLIKRLRKDPDFFVELLTFLFIPDDGGTDNSVDLNEAEVKQRKLYAELAYELFDQWKDMPGVDAEGNVDVQLLSNWLGDVLTAAKHHKREKGAYIQLGKLFAQYPEYSEHWPSKDLFSIMESIDTDSFFRNYETSMFNKRGLTSRGPYEGGDIERNNSAYFIRLYKECVIMYPKVAKVFKNLSKQYERMAKDMDDEATIAKLDY